MRPLLCTLAAILFAAPLPLEAQIRDSMLVTIRAPTAASVVLPDSVFGDVRGANRTVVYKVLDADGNVLTRAEASRSITSSSGAVRVIPSLVNDTTFVLDFIDAGFGFVRIVVDTTAAPEPPPLEDPGQVGDLSPVGASVLEWTEVSDGAGGAANYAVRHGCPTIAWGSAFPTETVVEGTGPGNVMQMDVSPSDDMPCQYQLVSFRGTLGQDPAFGSFSNVATFTATAPPEPPMSIPAEPLFTSGLHTTWRDMRAFGAGPIPGIKSVGGATGEHQNLGGVGPGGEAVNRFLYYNVGCLGGSDSRVTLSNGGWQPATSIPNVRTIITTWYVRPQSSYNWNTGKHIAGCTRGLDHKFYIARRESGGQTGQRQTLSARASGSTATYAAWGYTPARSDGAPNGVDWFINFESRISLGQYMNYGEPGGASKAPYQIGDGAWHRFTLLTRRESAAGAGDGATGLWIDGVPVFWFDGQDATRPEFGKVTMGSNHFGAQAEMLGIKNAGSAREEWIDETGVHVFYPTAELAGGGPGPTGVFPTFLGDTATIYSPTLATRLTPPFLGPTGVIYAPSIKHGIEPAFLGGTAAIYAPTLFNGNVVQPSFLGPTAEIFEPEIGHGIEPGFLGPTAVIYEPAAVGVDTVVQPPFVGPTAEIFEPSIVSNIEPPFVGPTAVIYAPTLPTTITPAFLGGTAAIYEPQVASGDGPSLLLPTVQSRYHPRGFAIRAKVETPNADHMIVIEGMELEYEPVRESLEAHRNDE